jgi:hypothetical protein
MKTKDELNQEILITTLKIREYSPKFAHSPGDEPEPNPSLESILEYNKFLKRYLLTLKKMLKKYKDEYRDKYFG